MNGRSQDGNPIGGPPDSGAAPGTPGSPGSAGPTVEVRRSGGFAGITRTGTVNLDEIPQARAEQWQSLLSEATAQTAGAGPQRRMPDAFVYQVSCPALGIEATFTQAATSPSERRLLDEALE